MLYLVCSHYSKRIILLPTVVEGIPELYAPLVPAHQRESFKDLCRKARECLHASSTEEEQPLTSQLACSLDTNFRTQSSQVVDIPFQSTSDPTPIPSRWTPLTGDLVATEPQSQEQFMPSLMQVPPEGTAQMGLPLWLLGIEQYHGVRQDSMSWQ